MSSRKYGQAEVVDGRLVLRPPPDAPFYPALVGESGQTFRYGDTAFRYYQAAEAAACRLLRLTKLFHAPAMSRLPKPSVVLERIRAGVDDYELISDAVTRLAKALEPRDVHDAVLVMQFCTDLDTLVSRNPVRALVYNRRKQLAYASSAA